MLRTIIFDFNGVILNDEPLHYQAMRDTVAELGIALSKENYWSKYLPLDDTTCLNTICADSAVRLTAARRRWALERKAELYQRLLQGQYPLFPGAAQFVKEAADIYPLALASGARRDEIEAALLASGLRTCFRVIIGAEDFVLGKPHPESFLLALSELNARLDGHSPPILPAECLVIEDSIDGVRGARAAGMMCVAVTNSYPRHQLLEANLIVSSLQEMAVGTLGSLLQERK